jgi:hypothetical protein
MKAILCEIFVTKHNASWKQSPQDVEKSALATAVFEVMLRNPLLGTATWKKKDNDVILISLSLSH